MTTPQGNLRRSTHPEGQSPAQAEQEDMDHAPFHEEGAVDPSLLAQSSAEQDQSAAVLVPAADIDQFPTQPLPRIPSQGWIVPYIDGQPIDEISTWILPVVQLSDKETQAEAPTGVSSYVGLIRNLLKSSGIYALAAVGAPLVNWLLVPFLAHQFSQQDYGIFTLLTTVIDLGVGVSQLGLTSAFFRAYNYDYNAKQDQRAVISTVIWLLCLASIPLIVGSIFGASFLAGWLYKEPSSGYLILLSALAIVAQNLSVPGFSWLRAENRALLYSLLSLGNVAVTLVMTIVLVGVLQWGVAGAIFAMVIGYASAALCTIPLLLLKAGIRLRFDIARGLLAFGTPLILNFISYWLLQLSDRYLLSILGSLTQTATYSVAYTLGSALAVVVVGPFTLAWPTTMFATAKRSDAPQVFQLLFRWLGIILLFAAFALSIVAHLLLDWIFPPSYQSAAPVIPFVAESIVFYGVYYLFMVGANITRKTWLAAVFTTIAAILNIGLNLFLIPRYAEVGAAASTLIAYAVMAFAAYFVNQRIYPVPFEIPRFLVALLIGVVLYLVTAVLPLFGSGFWAWVVSVIGLVAYGIILFFLGKGMALLRGRRRKTSTPVEALAPSE